MAGMGHVAKYKVLYCGKESMEKMHYGEDKLDEVMRRFMAGMGHVAKYKDWCHSSNFLKAFSQNHLKKGNPFLCSQLMEHSYTIMKPPTVGCTFGSSSTLTWLHITTRRQQSYLVLSSLAPTSPNFLSCSFSPACTIDLQYRGKVCLYGMLPQGHYTDPIHFWHLQLPTVMGEFKPTGL